MNIIVTSPRGDDEIWYGWELPWYCVACGAREIYYHGNTCLCATCGIDQDTGQPTKAAYALAAIRDVLRGIEE